MIALASKMHFGILRKKPFPSYFFLSCRCRQVRQVAAVSITTGALYRLGSPFFLLLLPFFYQETAETTTTDALNGHVMANVQEIVATCRKTAERAATSAVVEVRILHFTGFLTFLSRTYHGLHRCTVSKTGPSRDLKQNTFNLETRMLQNRYQDLAAAAAAVVFVFVAVAVAVAVVVVAVVVVVTVVIVGAVAFAVVVTVVVVVVVVAVVVAVVICTAATNAIE